ncbi:hypothetical protein OC25_17780 [Pedobacter kyungheensis]|uniref:Schlafen AlbA-2 domain-containing protein n=1 Tax=Pedobacter kyungheensis TaxID=1069985 RepID=A0A0C1FH16_9SPHI|nr:ATP-binding protein [Pedobacter kyungheensis]KIA92282.1 hypothetical protein OC25_17780 [Pedobacter kyungheensis]
MLEKVIQLIEYESENSRLDFKRVQYPLGSAKHKGEFLKDLSAMANGQAEEDKYIIIGISENGGTAEGFINIEELVSEADYQQFLNSYIEPNINFEYRSFAYQNHQLAYFRIYDNNERPYLFKKDFFMAETGKPSGFRTGDGYIRLGSGTKKMERKDFERIYKSRLDAPDKKDFIEIETYIGNSTNSEIRGKNFLDFKVSNQSSEQIHLDVELRIDAKGASLIIAEDLIHQEFVHRQRNKRNSNLFGFTDLPSVYMPNLHVELKKEDSEYVIKRTRRANSNGAVTIPQYDSDGDIFLSDLIIIPEFTKYIKGKLILRSDAFKGAPLIKELDFNFG